MREFTREEMLEIAKRCGIPVCQASADNPVPHIWETRQGNLLHVDGLYDPWPWGNNARAADAVIRSEAFKPWWALTKEPDGDFTVFDVSGKWNVIIIPSNKRPSTAVLEAVLMVRE